VSQLKKIVVCLFCVLNLAGKAQFAPQVGTDGTSAIHKDSSIFVNWAKACAIKRGWQNIADTKLGKVDAGTEESAHGAPGNGVVSLGDGGEAILTFNPPINNGPGYDFAVFENGFPFGSGSYYLELAFVEVSSDGNHFVRFNAISNTDTIQQIDQFSGVDASKINNLAGKYIGNYGTPFDLDEFLPLSSININQITHIRIVDVVGSMDNNFARRDSRGVKINDPWPTPFGSSGFDLDAVGVIHQFGNSGISDMKEENLFQFQNPISAQQNLNIRFDKNIQNGILRISQVNGSIVSETLVKDGSNEHFIRIDKQGVYFISLETNEGIITKRLIVN
jgi:hypothetical protein